MLYTSYYANSHNLHNKIKVCISLGCPIGVDYYLKELAPTYEILKEYKETGDKENFTNRYEKEILGHLNPNEIIGKLRRIYFENRGKDVVLLCFEKKGSFCHRHIVSEWLSDSGINIKEI